jgi:hypothetical protein
MLQQQSIFNGPLHVYTKLIKVFLILLEIALNQSVFFWWRGRGHILATTIIIGMLYSTIAPFISSLFIVGAYQVLMSIRGLPSDYAVLCYMLDAQLFLSLNPYFRENTACPF